MATLFWENFQQGISKWEGGNGQNVDLLPVADPLKKYTQAIKFTTTTSRPSSFSKAIYNPQKSYTVTFDYLSLDQNGNIAVNPGCILSIDDGGSKNGLTIAYAGAIKNTAPPTCPR